MLFNSFNFLIFFVLVTGLYFLLSHKYRWFMLIVASCIFYMYFLPVYILILFGTIIVDYFAGILIDKSIDPRKKKFFLVLSLITNIGILAFFKYFNFFTDNINLLAEAIGWNYSLDSLKIILPIGLSFHTFQAMSYTIEVYRGNQRAEKHLGIYSLYVMYYPQLVAGPIERPQNLLPQFHTPHAFNPALVSNGLKQMLIGFFKKIVIADNLAIYVNQVYDSPSNYESITLFIATIFFAFQIYCDFSGYSDIAIGASRIMGIELMQNFKAPYRANSISDFWARWHMSLSTWFKDYLYIPLGGNRVGFCRLCFNLFIVFVVSGFWHGASWNFIIWGALHGFFTIIEVVINKYYRSANGEGSGSAWKQLMSRVLVFYIVCFAWIFFRAENLSTAFVIAKGYIMGIPDYLYNLTQNGYLWLEPLIFKKNIRDYFPEFCLLGLSVLILGFINRIEYNSSFIRYLDGKKFVFRMAFYHLLLLLILFIGVFHSRQEFIYFQF